MSATCKTLAIFLTFLLSTACDTVQPICNPYCVATVVKGLDSNTVQLNNGITADVLNYLDISVDLPHGQLQMMCLRSHLEGREITYLPIRTDYRSNKRIEVKNKIINCKN